MPEQTHAYLERASGRGFGDNDGIRELGHRLPDSGVHLWQQTDNASGCENGTGKSLSWVWSTPQSVAHTSMGCCDTASMHPTLCVLGAGACEHGGRQRRPSHPRPAVDGMRSGAPHSTALAVAPHLQLQNWQRQGPRGLQCGVHQRKRSSSGSGPGALLRCRSQHRGRGQVSGGGHRAAMLSAASLGVASGSR